MDLLPKRYNRTARSVVAAVVAGLLVGACQSTGNDSKPEVVDSITLPMSTSPAEVVPSSELGVGDVIPQPKNDQLNGVQDYLLGGVCDFVLYRVGGETPDEAREFVAHDTFPTNKCPTPRFHIYRTDPGQYDKPTGTVVQLPQGERAVVYQLGLGVGNK